MEIYLGTDNDKIRFPIVPSSIGVNRSNNIDTESVIKLGEVPVFNGTSLKTIEFTSFFPNQEYNFCDYAGFMKPYEFSEKIQKWMYEGKPLRVIVTDSPTNMQCLIQQFDTVEQDGTRDLYFTLNLLEYRPIEVPNLSSSNTSSNSNNTQNTSRPNEVSTNSNNQQKTHKVVKGDCLWDIAQKYYGKGSLYPKIKEANTSKYPSLAKNNIIYVNWELIVP
ncbi:MAG: LysM peptidoglycan-binding domain-containing protein [Terrisporobacter sp.]|uniref:LysM peptidoglycan-binding domain-containing protein n=1 Tax=Terrisporobacter sp. TaxID=1965305 RepID=UPI002A90B115|nr:LysM peptidoglycan-binding domain-containing protein [Terrisporobacter sp.]MDY6154894.1 LysM peptidoglycan-binding domain-containing protein [Terrisporobacter sp.]